jgi:hypothetical protein
MLTLSLFRLVASAAGIMPWLLKLASWMLARSLNMPEPLIQDTGLFVFARVQAVENSVGKALCPIRLLRQLRSWLRRALWWLKPESPDQVRRRSREPTRVVRSKPFAHSEYDNPRAGNAE